MATSDGNDDSYVLVAAIDFGTTFSGYAFSFKTSPDKVFMNKNWGENVGCQFFKTPTCVLTGPNGEYVAFGHEAEDKYGSLIEDDDSDDINYDLYRHFKMILHTNQHISTKTVIPSVKMTLRPAIDIFSMSLEYLKNHLLEALNQQFPSKCNPHMIRWVITVPAIWREEAKQFMREAAFRAGCVDQRDSKKLIIALEPEAASLHCRSLPVSDFINMNSETVTFDAGTKYLVVDAGGGTVDITAHELLLNGQIKELHIANGGAMGGIKVDEQFTKLLCEVLGKRFIELYKEQAPQQWFSLMSLFEKVKKTFKLDGKCKLNITLGYSFGSKYAEIMGGSIEDKIKSSDHLGVSFKGGFLIVSHERAKSLFESVVSGIKNHVASLLQMKELRSVTYVMLVGGFAESLYLQNELKQCLRPNMTMLVPVEAQLAVIKGAVSFGHNPSIISSRVSAKTYGLSVMKSFKPGVHEEHRRETIHGKDWCRDIFEPIVLKGENIEVGKVIERRRVVHKPDQKSMNIRIYSSSRSDLAPVEYVNSSDFVRLGRINVKMPDSYNKGLDRAIMVRVVLGGTEIQVSGTDLSSGHIAEASIDMLIN